MRQLTSRIDSPDSDADIKLRLLLSEVAPSSFIVTAGAGSGKTTSLIKALHHVINIRGEELRNNNQKIACITYTEVAVEEIVKDVGDNDLLHVSTIHSFLWGLIINFQEDIRAGVKKRIGERLDNLSLEKEGFASKPRTKPSTIARNAEETARYESQLHDIQSVWNFTYGIGSNYSKGILGHDDIIRMVPELLLSKPLLAHILAARYPFFFVDESQDTTPDVVEALRKVAVKHSEKFCLGFFGDSMQKIYATGIGYINPEENWIQIAKPENYRSSQAVLELINKIRSQGDSLVQIGGQFVGQGSESVPVQGNTRLLVLPANGDKSEHIDDIRKWMAEETGDFEWIDPSGDVRVLVLVHKMAAARLGFESIYNAFNNKTSESIKEGFKEGTHWLVSQLIKIVIPLANAQRAKDTYAVISILREVSPHLNREYLFTQGHPGRVLKELNESLNELVEMLEPEGSNTVGDLLKHIYRTGLIELDTRLVRYFDGGAESSPESPVDDEGDETDAEMLERVVLGYFAAEAKQIRGYYTYIQFESPYSTQQGVKGSQFKHVVVLIDDSEGRHSQFSYEKLLGLKELSETDLEHQSNNEESVLERTLRLLYVSCSRAKDDLVVVVYSQAPDADIVRLKASSFFKAEDVYSINDLVS